VLKRLQLHVLRAKSSRRQVPSNRPPTSRAMLAYRVEGQRLPTAAFAGDPAPVDDLVVLSENATDRGEMDLKQAGRPRTRSL